MEPEQLGNLSWRERQVVEAVYARGQATAAEVQEVLPDPPSYSAVRALLAKLERKGLLRHVEEGAKYVYLPVVPRTAARESVLERMVNTFFDGSATKAVAALLDMRSLELSEDEIEEMAELIEQARRRGR